MPIPELILSTVVKALSNQLASSITDEYGRIHGISKKLKQWQGTLQTIHAVMDSAEERQVRGDPEVDVWLGQLREVAYDMEDLLDVLAVDAKKAELKAETGLAKLASCLMACCSKLNPCTLLSDHHMATEIEEINNRLDEIVRLKGPLRLAENPNARPSDGSSQPRFTTTSLQEPKFFGREKEIEELLVRLAGSDAADDCAHPYNVVSFVGMGGLGKTTLAQELYNHEELIKVFELRAWVCVSEVFDKVTITKSVLQWIAPSIDCKERDLNWLQNSLKDQLSGKKFFIVLDDIWNQNYGELQSLLKPFHSGRTGSKILVTTRNRRVAELVGDRDPVLLGCLSFDLCLSLLAYHAIGKESFDSQPSVRDIAEKLAGKCRGLPLAAKTIGGVLRFKSDDKKWKDVLDHDIWNKEGGDNQIPPALELSYIHLPIHLKRCFAACALFPKDYQFDREELINLRIAQGLLDKGDAKTYREVGINYSDELEARSLFQKAETEEPRYSMHDLVNDLAKSIGGVTYFSSDKEEGPSNEESHEKVRHAAFVTQRYGKCLPSKVDEYRSMKKLRAFVSFQVSRDSFANVYASNKVIHDLIMDLKYLRVLSLRYFLISKIPDQIGELKLLCSIDFSHTNIIVLPESICDLGNLEILLLRGCKELKKLPRNIQKLSKLICLDIMHTHSLGQMPPHIGRLTNLEILSKFVVGKEAGQGLEELGPLKGLQGELEIRNLQEVDDVRDASVADLHKKEGILDLNFICGSYDDEHELMLLERLQPPRKIECLAIYHYGSKTFPSWFGDGCLNNVVRITLWNCISVESLPPFGKLPWLKDLNIHGLNAVSVIGAEFYGTKNPFRSLSSLSFSSMPAWETWSSHGDCENEQPFPCLRKLSMRVCPVLNSGLPRQLGSLSELEIFNCPLLATTGESHSLPSLCEMSLEKSNAGLLRCLVDVTSMTKLCIMEFPQLVHLDRKLSTSWVSLEEMRITDCPRFNSFVDGDFGKQLPLKLKILEIYDCKDLKKLPGDLGGHPSLKEMSISSCHKLSSFPSSGLPPTLSKLSLSRCPALPPSQFLSMRLPEALEELILEDLAGLTSVADLILGGRCSRSLRKLKIRNCSSLTTLTDCWRHLSSLSELSVWECPVLELDCFPALPCNLSKFVLFDCPKVKCLPHDMWNLTSLRVVQVYGCGWLECLPVLPSNLSKFVLSNCPKVKCLPHDMRNLTSLREVEVYGCGWLDCFPALPCNLSKFKLSNCPKVKSLPNDMRNLTSLRVVEVSGCDGITCFPRGGLPSNLERLVIDNCKNLNQPLEEWGLSGLPALRELRIGGELECLDEMASFPPSANGGNDAWRRVFPSSLVKLEIWGMEKVERLAGGLRTHLTSLQEFHILLCRKMRYLPDEGLPDSLAEVRIEGCDLLKERCSEPDGEYWPHLERIPCVHQVTEEGYYSF